MEFLYVNANEGTASGGHAAIRFDDEVFHFQHVPSGLLRVARDDFRWFRRLYGLAENRTINGHRIDVSDETWTLLREGFNRRLLIEDEQFDQLHSLDQDIRLLRLHLSATDDSSKPARIWVKGLGLFMEDGWNPEIRAMQPGRGNASLQALRKAIERHRGADLLARISQRWRHLVAAIRPEEKLPDPGQLQEDRFVPARYGYAEHYTGALTALAALEVLQRGLNLGRTVLLRPRGPEFALDTDELAHLQAFRDHLLGTLVQLPDEESSTWGLPLLIGMARLIALDLSLSTKQLTVLDLATEDESPPVVSNEAAGLIQARTLEFAARDFRQAKYALRQGGIDQRAYGRLEASANLLFHGSQPLSARRSGPAPLQALPARPAPALAIAPRMSRRELATELGRLELAESAYHARLDKLYPYDLITSNCVSEIFRTVDNTIARYLTDTGQENPPGQAAVRNESVRRLGGHVESGATNFVPFLAFKAVGEHWRVVETRQLPSWLHERLRDARRRENPLLVDLRESNVLSASLYRWHDGDAAFLFFSEDRPWFRPVSGALNTAVGLGQSLTGLFTLPWDGGHNLRQGAKGFLISLPELFFFNIRKGSYPEFSAFTADIGLEPEP